MQKNKTLIISLICLAVLILVYLLWHNVWQGSANKMPTQKLNFSNLDSAQTIEIIRNQQITTLTKENNNWQVVTEENSAANSQFIDNLISGLKEINSGLIISSQSQTLPNFNLTEELATKLKITDQQNNILAEMLIGKSATPEYSKTYIKLPNSDNVLLVPGNLFKAVNQNDWKQPPPTATNTNSNTNQ